MNLKQCQQEIIERYYLVGSFLVDTFETDFIRIIELLPCEHKGSYFVRCNYVQEESLGKFRDDVFSKNLKSELYPILELTPSDFINNALKFASGMV